MIKRFTVVLTFFMFIGLDSAIAMDALDDVRLFQFSHKDGAISTQGYALAGGSYADYDNYSSFFVNAQAGYPVTPQIEVDGELGFINLDVDNGDDESGLTDMTVSARYQLFEPGVVKFEEPQTADLQATVGGYATLPVGDEDIGQDHFNFGVFSAARYPLANKVVMLASIGLDFIEEIEYNYRGEKDEDYELSLSVGAGALYPFTDQLSLVGEFNVQTENDYMMLSCGADYQLANSSRVRGALGIGLDDGAPDLSLTAQYLLPF